MKKKGACCYKSFIDIGGQFWNQSNILSIFDVLWDGLHAVSLIRFKPAADNQSTVHQINNTHSHVLFFVWLPLPGPGSNSSPALQNTDYFPHACVGNAAIQAHEVVQVGVVRDKVTYEFVAVLDG